jgi:hypothetical protein
MATCGHCKKPGQTVAHVRTCGQASGTVATATRTLPDLEPGMVFTVDLEDGHWLTEGVLIGDKVQARRLDGTQRVVVWPLKQVELVFPNAQAARDYELAQRTDATLRRNREILHGDPNYCRGCAKGWRGAKWHREGCPNVPAAQPIENNHHASGATLREGSDTWGPINKLRAEVKPHLHRKIRNAMVGHFALRAPADEGGVVKFYRVKLMTAGNWAGKVFVEAQASDDFHPVRSPETLTQVLTGILTDPHAAEELYGQELGQCYRCNRTLTDETSRALGIGRECRSKL